MQFQFGEIKPEPIVENPLEEPLPNIESDKTVEEQALAYIYERRQSLLSGEDYKTIMFDSGYRTK